MPTSNRPYFTYYLACSFIYLDTLVTCVGQAFGFNWCYEKKVPMEKPDIGTDDITENNTIAVDDNQDSYAKPKKLSYIVSTAMNYIIQALVYDILATGLNYIWKDKKGCCKMGNTTGDYVSLAILHGTFATTFYFLCYEREKRQIITTFVIHIIQDLLHGTYAAFDFGFYKKKKKREMDKDSSDSDDTVIDELYDYHYLKPGTKRLHDIPLGIVDFIAHVVIHDKLDPTKFVEKQHHHTNTHHIKVRMRTKQQQQKTPATAADAAARTNKSDLFTRTANKISQQQELFPEKKQSWSDQNTNDSQNGLGSDIYVPPAKSPHFLRRKVAVKSDARKIISRLRMKYAYNDTDQHDRIHHTTTKPQQLEDYTTKIITSTKNIHGHHNSQQAAKQLEQQIEKIRNCYNIKSHKSLIDKLAAKYYLDDNNLLISSSSKVNLLSIVHIQIALRDTDVYIFLAKYHNNASTIKISNKTSTTQISYLNHCLLQPRRSL